MKTLDQQSRELDDREAQIAARRQRLDELLRQKHQQDRQISTLNEEIDRLVANTDQIRDRLIGLFPQRKRQEDAP